MTFVTKLASHLVSPGDLTLVLLTGGILLSWFSRTRMSGIAISTVALLIFLVIEYSPVTGWITTPLENRFLAKNLPSQVNGLIVLGGAVDTATTLARNVPTLTGEAERMTEFVRLAKLYPRAKLVFAGGGGSQGSPPTMSEADAARMFFIQQGLDAKRILFESTSQNTYENVLFAKSLARPKPEEKWILITSAQDVPRCVAVFRKLQWPIIPRAVAYKSDADNDLHLGSNLKSLDRSVHEWVGLLFYRLTGKSDELFPRPVQ
ncbi:MAG: YdcF family protein [Alphaproteobacteria bacterium]|nr:YdcF family protein [Alphaproteobacteria bacterium]